MIVRWIRRILLSLARIFGRPNLGNTVCLMAHPDDGWYSAAATLRRARKLRNKRTKSRNTVTSVSASNGGAGSQNHDRWHPDTIGTLREAEERKAFSRIDVSDVRFLGLPDGKLHEIDFEEGVELVLALLRELDPDTMITYGPDGLTGHSDHMVISGWVTEAVIRWIAEQIADGKTPHLRLLYVVADHKFVDEIVPVLHEAQAIYAEPTAVHADKLFIDHWLSKVELAIKLLGIADHHTQSDPLGVAIGGLQLLEEFWFAHETLVEADLELPVAIRVELLLSSSVA